MSGPDLVTHLSIIALFGGLLSLDRRASFQLMLSQPMVAVGLLGWVFGDVTTGVLLGCIVQLLWMSCVLFGANIPRNDTLAALAIGGAVFLFGHSGVGQSTGITHPSIWGLAIIFGAPACLVGQWVDIRLDHMNRHLVVSAETAVQDGRLEKIAQNIAFALVRIFMVNAVLTALSAYVVFVCLNQFIGPMDGHLSQAFDVIGTYILPGLGIAVTMTMVRPRSGMVIATITFIIVCAGLMKGSGI